MDDTEMAGARPDSGRAGGSWFRQMLGLAAPPPISKPATRDAPAPQASRPSRTVAGDGTSARTTPLHVHRFDSGGWGHTVLVDSDGHGVIQVGDVLLTECAPIARGVWVDASRDFCLFTIRRKGGCTDLAICRRDDPSGGSILVHDWAPSRSLGICLSRG